MRTVCTKRLHLARIGLVCLIAFGVAGVMVLAVSAAGDSHPVGPASAEAAVPSSIDRDLEPVILTGEDLPLLAGAPTDSLFLYAYRGESWEQIPFQVDEKDGGAYVPTMGSPLDADDEIVFMASDLGARPPDEQVTATLPISPTWYRIEVTDPLSPTKKGWAYVVRSSALTKTFTETYTLFDPATNQITTTRYTIGLAEDRPYFHYLALNESGVDIVDRSKVRIHTNLLPIQTEESTYLQLPSLSATKEGPVRVVARQGNVMGYAGVLQTTLAYTSPLDVTTIRASVDFAGTVVTSTFYNKNVAGGVPVDGAPDVVAEEPLSLWWQLSGGTGTVVQVSDAEGTGGTLKNYYKDDDTIDPVDTGDQKSYGDAGLKVESPSRTIRYRTLLYVLPPNQDNVGGTYADYYDNPLDAATTPLFRYRTYVPLVLRN
ncbi:MAG: hypothetical protein PVH50_10715 [Anaerolineae bacterium]|jgi:hypothetical protein